MTRTERKKKLSNAVKEYRGSYDAQSKKWIRAPIPAARSRCIVWLRRLDVQDIGAHLLQIDNFKSMEEFHTWLETL